MKNEEFATAAHSFNFFYRFRGSFFMLHASFFHFYLYLCTVKQCELAHAALPTIMQELSVLIPVYNSCCTPQVERLWKLCDKAGIHFEIIVADDGSSDPSVNEPVNALPHCRLIIKGENSGSAATRNLLAQEAQYDWLLFIDADVDITHDDYIHRYIVCAEGNEVVNGGIAVGSYKPHNLRWLYEKHAEPQHDTIHRQAMSHQEFRSTNFLIRRDVMLRCPFDERFKASGYEDVFFGRTLHRAQVRIIHIDNPVTMSSFEPNDRFMAKTERNLQTLHRFNKELKDYSGIIKWSRRLVPHALWRSVFRLLLPTLRRQLSGESPHLFLYHVYRIGYYMTLKEA